MAQTDVDVAILGGGIAGLWLLARLRKAGYSALLLENAGLGAGQTLASQGIIHGGLKYALDLKLNADADALADMPTRWRACLDGTGEIDLRGARLAAGNHLFWARKTLASRIAGFFGSKLLRGRVDALKPEAWPAVLRDPDSVAAVYALDECVLDVPSLLAALNDLHSYAIKRVDGEVTVAPQADHVVLTCSDTGGRVRRIAAGTLVSTAGAGNEAIIAQLGLPARAAQRRPLQMLLVDHAPAPLWAHCFDASDKPRVTITTHYRKDGVAVWYVGGLVAEQGATQREAELIAAGRAELSALLPQQDFSRCRFAGFRVDRAEGATDDGRKPEGPVLHPHGRVLLAWPTKLALAPQLADRVLAELPPATGLISDYNDWPAPGIAPAPWETVSWK